MPKPSGPKPAAKKRALKPSSKTPAKRSPSKASAGQKRSPAARSAGVKKPARASAKASTGNKPQRKLKGKLKGKPPHKHRSAKSGSGSGSGSGSSAWIWRLFRWLLVLGLLAALGLFLYALVLDREVTARFEGKRWALPAQVFARPLELYAGAPIQQADVVRELRLLGYRHHKQATSTGSFGTTRHGLVINARAFRFWDGDEPQRRVSLRFDQQGVTDLRDGAGKEVDLLRLDPMHIGGIYPKQREDRVLVRVDQVPKRLIRSLVEVEDRHFYQHHGVSPKSILRASMANIRAGGVVQGGSTLTQQLVKNFYLSSERSLKRKLNEALMALSLEWHYSKSEILEAYLNEVYLGQAGRRAIHGFGLGSWFYFQRPLNELNVEHVALLVGLVKGPSYYNPRRHPKRAKHRRDVVLDVMAQRGVISAAQAKAAKTRPLGVSKQAPGSRSPYPAYLDLVRRQLARDYRDEDLRSEGLRIFTNLDPIVQFHAERAVAGQVRRVERRKHLEEGKLQAAAVVVSRASGNVLALVAGRDPAYAGFNRALDANRQVGSLIKPAVYLAALEAGGAFSLATLLNDQAVSMDQPGSDKPWQPKNADGKTHGQVMLIDALAHSYNLATIDLGLRIGLDSVLSMLKRLGVERRFKPYPSLLLGAQSMSPLEVAQMYQTLAAGGFRTPLRAIRAVMSADGQPLERYGLDVKQVVQPAPVYLLDQALLAVTREGTGRRLSRLIGKPVIIAGKTGTTDDWRDSWFAGFGQRMVGVVWVGMDDFSSARLSGSSGAMPIFAEIMKRTGETSLVLPPPANVQQTWVSKDSGLLASPDCPNARALPLMADSGPIRTDACVDSGTSPAAAAPSNVWSDPFLAD